MLSFTSRFVALSCFVAGAWSALPYEFCPDGEFKFIGTSFGVPGSNASFDYVIVGGGTAGLTVASRLAAAPDTSVAVIEAGGFYEVDNGNLSSIPSDIIYFSGSDPQDFNPLIDWDYVTTPQAVSNTVTPKVVHQDGTI